MRTETDQTIRLADYKPSDYAISRVDLDFRLDPTATVVTSRLLIEPRADTPAGTPLVLDGDDLVLTRLSLNEVELAAGAYSATPTSLTIHTPPTSAFVLEVVTTINPSANTKLMGLYRSSGTYCTQCEAEGFRRITYFLDRPDVLAVYTVKMAAKIAEAPLLLSNGNRLATGELEGPGNEGWHYAIWNDPWPKPAYLFALVAGDLALVADHFTTESGRPVELGIYVEHGNEGRATYAMDALKRSMRWDETAFGREYDLDIFNIVAVSDFNMGAMENKGLNVFNDKYVLADPEVATDTDYAGIEAVIAHEYFHNWTGNRITCRDWFQLCLKEGLTVFRDQEFSSDMRSRPVKRISDVRTLRAQQFAEDGGPLAHPVRPEEYKEINNFYTATVYEKGAEVIRMLKTVIGADAFRAGMDLYFDRHDGDASTIEQFIACFAEASKQDLSQFMLWYRQSGTPSLIVSTTYDATKQTLQLDIEQRLGPTPGQPVKKPMVIPVRFGLVGNNGHDMTAASVSGADVAGDVIVLTAEKHSITFTGIGERPVVSLLRGFSAPVKLSFAQSDADLAFLMRADSDPFNRWQAATSLAMKQLVELTEAARNGRTADVSAAYLEALDTLISDETLAPAFRALVLGIPGENDIARDLGDNVDPDAISKAYRAVKGAIGAKLAVTLDALIARHATTGAYDPDAAHAGRRALVNVAVDLRAASGDAAILAGLADRYSNASNMTERLAALTTLVYNGVPAAETALADFYSRFQNVPLAIDKWFMVQATAPQPTALDQVKALTNHPAFTFGNPNRVRSLITSFASANPSQFGRADGAGFNFIADTVIRLDDTNPQVASRMLATFKSWKALEPTRRALAEAALKRVLAKPNLSRDVKDIAERSLA